MSAAGSNLELSRRALTPLLFLAFVGQGRRLVPERLWPNNAVRRIDIMPDRFRALCAVVLLGPVVGSIHAAEPTPADLKAALADLTTNIENVDNRGFEKASRTMVDALSGVPPSRFDYAADCMPWGSPGPDAKPQDILLIAFMAGVVQERVFGDANLSLYRGWLNTIKYYQHYRTEGTIGKIDALEKLIKLEKRGSLMAAAKKVQAKHPNLFDHIELGPRGPTSAPSPSSGAPQL